jgi:hypothetical protein
MQAIKTAAGHTSSDFAYLLHASGIESGLDPNARAKASSATGLFQFTGQTWLQMMKAHGAEFGLGNYAGQIQIAGNKTAYVSDPASRQAILDLRKDPQIAAEMACALNKVNSESLRKNVGGMIGPTELYLAHFLGAGGASVFLKSMRANPNAKAADILPAAAEANPPVFFGAGGQPRSLEQIYRHFAQKFDQTPAGVGANSSEPTLAAAFVSAVPQPSPSVTVASGTVSPILASISSGASLSLATMMQCQMDMADLTSALALDDEDENDSAISVLA